MSSHHFVKEEQEPALILGIAHLPDYLSDLLEWAPTTIVLEDAVEETLDKGFKVDAVISVSDHVSVVERFDHQRPLTFFQASSSLEAIRVALRHLSKGGQKAVNIVYGDFDSIRTVVDDFLSQLDINVFIKGLRYSYCKAGFLQKWLAKDDAFEVFNETSIASISSNLHRNGKQLTVIEDGIARIEAHEPFWICERIF